MTLNVTEEKTSMSRKHKSDLAGSDLLGGCDGAIESNTSIIPSRPNFDKNGVVMAIGFIKLSREAEQLIIKDPDVFVLLSLIAIRALRKESKFNFNNLQIGQALIGFQDLPWTEQRYREVKKRTEQKYFLATFKGTSKGTIATLTNKAIYDINENSSNDQNNDKNLILATNEQRPNNDPTTTKEEVKKEKKVKNKTPKPPPSAGAIELLEFFIDSLKKHIPKIPPSKHPVSETAANFDILLKEHSSEEIRKVILYAHTGWWARKIHGPLSLKNKFLELSIGMEKDEKKSPWKKEIPVPSKITCESPRRVNELIV